MPSRLYTALDPQPLARTVVTWSWIQVGASFALCLGYLAWAANAAGAILALLVSVVFLIVYGVTGVLALKWIYRVTRNAHAFAEGLPTSPAWAVGWFFVPVAALWKPYAALSDVWQASERPAGWRTAPKPRWLAWWWIAWIAYGVANYIYSVTARFTEDRGVLALMLAVCAGIQLVATVLFVRLVRGLTTLQSAQITFGGERATDAPPSGSPEVFEGV